MAHNGGRTQENFWFPGNGDYPFVNKLKMASRRPGMWQFTTSAAGRPAAGLMDANGYPVAAATSGSPNFTLPNGGWQTIFQEEGVTARSGRRVLQWDGGGSTANITLSGIGTVTIHSGSLTGNSQRVELSFTSGTQVTLVITSTDGTLTNLRWMHVADEPRYISEKAAHPNREPFGTKFLERLTELNPGVLRFLDWQLANTSNIGKWVHRTPINHVSYNVGCFDPTYVGTLDTGPTNFTMVKSGFVFADGEAVIGNLTVSTSGTPTLDVNGTGAKAVKVATGTTPYLAAWSQSIGSTSRRITFNADETLNCYIVVENGFDEGLLSGIPPEVQIDLCNALNCHGHFVMPSMCCEGPTDYAFEFATYARDNLNSGLQFRLEAGPNECWNGIFVGTKLGRAWGKAHWTSDQGEHNWYAKSLATNGEVVSDVFSGDQSRYAILCGFQSSVALDLATNRSTRMEGTKWVLDGGNPASDFVTHICPAGYWGSSLTSINTSYMTMLEFIRQAKKWYEGDATEKLEALAWFHSGVDSFISTTSVERFDRFSGAAQYYGKKLTQYEGGFYPGDITADMRHGIDGITKGATTTLTINKIGGIQAHAFVAGMAIRFPTGAEAFAGMTQIAGLTSTVLSVTDTTVEVNIDSTTFSDFTPGGGNSGAFSANLPPIRGIIYDGYGNTGVQIANLFTYALKDYPDILYSTQRVFELFLSYPNAEYPSDYMFVGPDNQWSKFNNIHDPTPSAQWDAMVLVNHCLHRGRWTFTP
jgi:hypothetical protein